MPVACVQVKPHVLIGLAGAGKLFTEEVLKLMGQYNEHPVIMPMSNPTHRMECNAEEAQAATGKGHHRFAVPAPVRIYSLQPYAFPQASSGWEVGSGH